MDCPWLLPLITVLGVLSTLWHAAVVPSFSLLSVPHCTDIPNLLIHMATDGHLDCFHFLVIMDKAAMNICAQVFWCSDAFTSLGYISKSGIAAAQVGIC